MRATWIKLLCVLFAMPIGLAFGNFVKINPNDATSLLGVDSKELAIRGVNRFAIYEDRDNRDDLDVSGYFKLLKDKGFNMVRVFVREGYVKEGRRLVLDPIEPRLGSYSVNHLDELRSVFVEANKHKIYVVLCLFDHYYLHHAWKADPNSGEVRVSAPTPYFVEGTKSDFFYQSPILRQFQKSRIRHLVNEFKNEKYLLAWEPMNEVNGVLKNSYRKEVSYVVDWFNDMARTIKEEDPNHLVSLSLTGDLYWDNFGGYFPWRSLYASEWTDIIQVHAYAFDGNWPDYIQNGLRKELIEAKKYNKPVWLGEFGVKLANPKWTELTVQAFELARQLDVPAMIWTHRYDPYGGLTDQKIDIYHQMYPDMIKN